MNISYNWLREYLPLEQSPEEVAEILTSIGLEVSGITPFESVRGALAGVVIGKVLRCEEHPNSDHLHVTTVDIGTQEPLQIVCGAPNIAAGQVVPVATIGTTLYKGDEEFKIKKSKIRGEESFGMICSETELGVGSDSSGIMVLPEEICPGTPAADYFDITRDTIIEVDITPNRVDATSHYGVARDLYAYLKVRGEKIALTLEIPELPTTKETPLSVHVDDSEACLKYSGIVMRDVTVRESPEWLRTRLLSIGQKPINNIVDISNYVLHAVGQPLHIFDRTKIGEELVVRRANAKEKLETLDGVIHELTEQDLVIANGEKPLCLAGVMGGIDSGVTADTTEVFIESATFHPTFVRKTARRHGISSDSSFRFERGLHPDATRAALCLAVELIKKVAGGEVISKEYEISPNPPEEQLIPLSLDKTYRLIGKKIPREQILRILEALEIKVLEESSDLLKLRVPGYRYDVRRGVDVVEEILRIYGYNNIEFPKKMTSNLTTESATDKSMRWQQKISEQLTGAGFNEILNNSLSKEEYYTTETDTIVHLINPLSSDLSVLRTTLLHGGLEVIAFNHNRKATGMRLYEFGNCYRKGDEAGQPLAGYVETQRLALWMTGDETAGNWLTPGGKQTPYDLKAVLLRLIQTLGLSLQDFEISNSSNDPVLSTGQVWLGAKSKKPLIRWGIVRPEVAQQADVEIPVYFAELWWGDLMGLIEHRQIASRTISKFPSVRRDFSLLLDHNISFAQIEEVAYQTERRLLQSVTLVDVYEDPKHLPAGKKSYAVSFELQDPEKTLSDKTIDKTMARLHDAFVSKFDAKLR